ncbi:hypothetical protein BAE44_0024413 [Dichanthelium oligosanthes]|uniref:Uncharacterized protein n=1 Tax=Dichanthelium oligosanthes TaxID=888268 RepID=A0A1E5UNV3_9POAL|nr:hypothetical protein BAE44_0024413 [Dichanthelium oligosanthes]
MVSSGSATAPWQSPAAAPVRRLLRRLRCSLRRSAARPSRAAVSFGYDLHSYSQNFDDGIISSPGGHRL